MKRYKQIRKIFQGVKKEDITFDHLAAARQYYVELAEEAYETEKWTEANLAQSFLAARFIDFLESNQETLKDYNKSIFLSDNGYSFTAQIQEETDSEDPEERYQERAKVKMKNFGLIEDLIETHGFYLNT